LVANRGFAQYYVRFGRISRNIRKTGRDPGKTAKEGTMAGAYDDRDGKIWMDGKLVDWREANVHILTHAMHYASSVFEGERAYNGKIFESRRHSERLHWLGPELDFEIPWTVDEIEAAKYEVLKANGLTDAYVRAVAWRGAGEDMGVSSAKNPVAGHRGLGMGQLLRRREDEGRQARHLQVEASLARDDPGPRQGGRSLHDLHHVQARGRGEGLFRRAVHGLSRLRGRGDGRQHLLREGWRGAHAQGGLCSSTASPGRP
jgi:hypothetical protein